MNSEAPGVSSKQENEEENPVNRQPANQSSAGSSEDAAKGCEIFKHKQDECIKVVLKP
jgi:threonine dehydrogenase-like Zn-dependent dehydrogenase